MRKENFVKCKNCKQEFNNAYRHGIRKDVCSESCCNSHKLQWKIEKSAKYNKTRREKNLKLKSEHRCIHCKKEVKPTITYPQYCEKHNYKKKFLIEQRKEQ